MPYPLNDNSKTLNAVNLLALPPRFGCPVWAYDANIIRQRIAQLHHFDVIRFAQKACSNIHIFRLIREQSVKVDSVSLGEIECVLWANFNRAVHHVKWCLLPMFWIRLLWRASVS